MTRWFTLYPTASHRYMGNAKLLALFTSQRLGDISKIKFSDVWDDHPSGNLGKTRSKIAIPFSLRVDAIGWNMRDVIYRYRD